ncbi:MAG: hypothetical protein AB1521_14390 [Bacteroidota bacterium]
MKKLFYILIVTFAFASDIFPQYNGKDFSVSVNYNYTTTSKLFLQPNTPDPLLRNIHEDLDAIYSYSVEARYKISESMIVGLSAEYIKKTFTNTNFSLGANRVKVNDGYKVIPVEVSLFYLLPFSTEYFKFFMGGGGGVYFGSHIRDLGDVHAEDEGSEVGYGIHVAVGMDYMVNQYLSIRGQMRFRDPEIDLKSKYSNSIVNYEGSAYLLSSRTFPSKVNVDGMTFTIGAAFNF